MFKGILFLTRFIWKHQKSYLFLKTISQLLTALAEPIKDLGTIKVVLSANK